MLILLHLELELSTKSLNFFVICAKMSIGGNHLGSCRVIVLLLLFF